MEDRQPTPQPPESAAEDVHRATETQLIAVVGSKAERKLKARRDAARGVWFGLGMFGIVGWSVAVPTLAFLALGIWIDRRWPSQYSWTLMLLVLGALIGCANAWYWISRERERMES